MKESISNALVFNIIIVFVIILIVFFVGSLSYSKASKVKNRIVEVIEKEHGYNAIAREEIEDWLANGSENGTGIGYRINTNVGAKNSCPNIEAPGDATVKNLTNSNRYEYCVYEIESCDENRCDVYYRVVTFMYFDVPIVQDLIKIPIRGETMTFTELNT